MDENSIDCKGCRIDSVGCLPHELMMSIKIQVIAQLYGGHVKAV